MKTIEDPLKSNRRLVLTVAISVCAIALFGIIPSADAEESTAITPDVVNSSCQSLHGILALCHHTF